MHAGAGDGSGSQLTRHTAWLVSGRLVVAVFGWAGTVLIARQLGQEAFGQFTLVFSLLGMLSIVTDLGVGRVAVSAVMAADDDAEKGDLAGTYIILRTVLGLVGYVTALLVVIGLDYPVEVIAATAVGGTVVLFATPSHAYNLAFQVRDRLSPLAILDVFGQLAQIALTVVLILAGGGLVLLTIPPVVNDFLKLMWKIRASHRLLEFHYRINSEMWWAMIREAIPLTAGTAFVTLYYRVDSVMLSRLDTFEAVGSYGVAYKFADLAHFVPLALTIAILAPLTATWPDDPDQFGRIVRSGFRILAVVGGAIVIVFWNFATPLVTLLYGSVYADAGTATKLVVGAESVAFFSSLIITALIAASRHRVYPAITALGLVFNIAINLVLIPRYSIEGAAVATVLTEILVVALLATRIRELGVVAADRRVLLLVPVLVVVGLVVGWTLDLVVPWPVAAGITVTLYAALVVATGLFRPERVAAIVGRGSLT